MFDVLYEASKSRGNFAFSYCFVNIKGRTKIYKHKGIIDLDNVKEADDDVLFLGHCQAPTSSKRTFATATSHPFECDNWIIAHNGVLTNFAELNEKFTPTNKNPVDSSVIAALLASFEKEFSELTPTSCLEQVLTLLQGTFALWVYHKKTNQTFLVRQGSTLYANLESGDFCSIQGNGWIELDEGVIYEITDNGIKSTGTFVNKTPFLL